MAESGDIALYGTLRARQRQIRKVQELHLRDDALHTIAYSHTYKYQTKLVCVSRIFEICTLVGQTPLLYGLTTDNTVH